MSDERHDYGPAGCAEGCANRGASLLLILGAFVALVRYVGKPARKGGAR
jgi:hypothetical protein